MIRAQGTNRIKITDFTYFRFSEYLTLHVAHLFYFLSSDWRRDLIRISETLRLSGIDYFWTGIPGCFSPNTYVYCYHVSFFILLGQLTIAVFDPGEAIPVISTTFEFTWVQQLNVMCQLLGRKTRLYEEQLYEAWLPQRQMYWRVKIACDTEAKLGLFICLLHECCICRFCSPEASWYSYWKLAEDLLRKWRLYCLTFYQKQNFSVKCCILLL